MKSPTTLWYVNKALILSSFKIVKAHIIDDDCSEYIATIKADWIHRNWYGPNELQILDLEPYDRETWNRMEAELEWPQYLLKI